MDVITLCIGGVGRNRDAACGHDCQIGYAPFGPVFRNQHYPVAIRQADAAQVFRQNADLVCHFAPAACDPHTVFFCAEERFVAVFIGPLQEKFDEVSRLFDITQLQAYAPPGPKHIRFFNALLCTRLPSAGRQAMLFRP